MLPVFDMIGKTYCGFKVLEYHHRDSNRNSYVLCQCPKCGDKFVFRSSLLRRGDVGICKCSRPEHMFLQDLKGHRYGRLTVLELDHVEKCGAFWKCKCDCGNVRVIRANSLRTGDVRTCGANCKYSKPRNVDEYDILYKTPEERLRIIYTGMLYRCSGTEKAKEKFPHYSGKGIKVCDEWLNSRQSFLRLGNI